MAPPIEKDNINDVKSTYDKLLRKYLKGGMDEGEAKSMAQKDSLMAYEETDHYLGLEYRNQDEIKIRKIISMDNLEQLPQSKEYGCWSDIPLTERNTILFNCGLSVHKAGWWEEIGQHRNLQGKLRIGKYVVSEERLDKGWVELLVKGRSMASFDAKLMAKGDKSLEWELKGMM